MSLPNHFDLIATEGAARTGRLTTPHGAVRTPAFMPVGTAGAMKGMHWREVRDAGADIVLGNTYHLMLRPGAERVAALGGLQRFTGWNGPMLTDSGGFQVMSLSELRKVTESAVTFRSHLDGTKIELSPERAVEVQRLLGSDIAMQLDECVRLPAERADIERAMQLSLRWGERSKRHDLKAARIRQDGSRPIHEAVQPTEPGDPLRTRPQHQMIGVAEHDIGAGRRNAFRQHCLDGAGGSNRHESRRADGAARRMDDAAPRSAVARCLIKTECAHVGRNNRDASP